ncbi:hypothetical protein Q0M94_11930 [Deinococcus radiomollis]|uniref:hypothetical protein n=1 Tax=Deinococcus radiomollis TaxID=468916 RepID=UPI0038925CE1
MFLNVQNPNALNAATLALAGAYRLFVPIPGTAFATSPGKAIHLGHIRAPAETTNITKKKIDSTVYGAAVTILDITTKIEESGTFETASANDLLIRSLWAGSKPTAGSSGAVVFQPSHVYNLNDLVTPTVANGHYYKVTTAGTSGSTEPTWPTTASGTVVSGTVTFTEQGSTTGTTVIANTHASINGMLIDVYLSAITGGNSEIFVAPSASLNGDGYGAGRDGTNETLLKFAYTLLAPSGYVLPTAAGSLGTQTLNGGFNILNVTPGTEDTLINAIVTGFAP